MHVVQWDGTEVDFVDPLRWLFVAVASRHIAVQPQCLQAFSGDGWAAI